ncbi:MAG: protein-glutamate O-methyltransferase [Spirochaetota bacterium]|nr:protein-glutamate O-methyltransferase [Spirochaetota bacterium]
MINRDHIHFKEITNKEFTLFKDIVYQESGIKLSDVKKALLQSRLLKRLRALNIDSYSNYYNFLINNYETEKINLINCITTNKTDFFREEKHFIFLNDIILPKFEKNNKKKIRVWSAGCATGEEPYSIAIILNEYYRGKKIPDIKILATDIDTVVLKKGEEGIYESTLLENVDKEIIKRYFYKGIRENEGFLKIKDSLKDIVYFRRLNLLCETYPMKHQFDLIFCRNVIIYFDNETRTRLFNQFHKYLYKDGYFFAGHSETLSGITDKFTLIGNTIYEKVI